MSKNYEIKVNAGPDSQIISTHVNGKVSKKDEPVTTTFEFTKKTLLNSKSLEVKVIKHGSRFSSKSEKVIANLVIPISESSDFSPVEKDVIPTNTINLRAIKDAEGKLYDSFEDTVDVLDDLHDGRYTTLIKALIMVELDIDKEKAIEIYDSLLEKYDEVMEAIDLVINPKETEEDSLDGDTDGTPFDSIRTMYPETLSLGTDKDNPEGTLNDSMETMSPESDDDHNPLVNPAFFDELKEGYLEQKEQIENDNPDEGVLADPPLIEVEDEPKWSPRYSVHQLESLSKEDKNKLTGTGILDTNLDSPLVFSGSGVTLGLGKPGVHFNIPDLSIESIANLLKEISNINSENFDRAVMSVISGKTDINELDKLHAEYTEEFNTPLVKYVKKYSRESEAIKLDDYTGTWYAVDNTTINGVELLELESEVHGDDAGHIIIDVFGEVKVDEVYNGFDDYYEKFDLEK